METERRNQLVLGALLVFLAFVMYRAWTSTQAPSLAPSSNSAQAGGGPGGRTPAIAPAPDVHLPALEDERPKPGPVSRDLFRFKPKAAPSTAPRETPLARPAPTGPPPPPPLAPIPLKFIGIVEAPDRKLKLAVLSDGRDVFKGTEGQVIAGQYRLIHIGAESVEMSYLDGRGRQTIRLSGG